MVSAIRSLLLICILLIPFVPDPGPPFFSSSAFSTCTMLLLPFAFLSLGRELWCVWMITWQRCLLFWSLPLLHSYMQTTLQILQFIVDLGWVNSIFARYICEILVCSSLSPFLSPSVVYFASYNYFVGAYKIPVPFMGQCAAGKEHAVSICRRTRERTPSWSDNNPFLKFIFFHL